MSFEQSPLRKPVSPNEETTDPESEKLAELLQAPQGNEKMPVAENVIQFPGKQSQPAEVGAEPATTREEVIARLRGREQERLLKLSDREKGTVNALLSTVGMEVFGQSMTLEDPRVRDVDGSTLRSLYEYAQLSTSAKGRGEQLAAVTAALRSALEKQRESEYEEELKIAV